MTQISFSIPLYSSIAVDEALRIYADFGRFEVERSESACNVRIFAGDDVDEGALTDELANYALGVTIERSRTDCSL